MITVDILMISIDELEKFRASFPCIFFRLRSSECALSRYGLGLPIKEAIRNTISSVMKGLEKRKKFLPNLHLVSVDKITDDLVKTYISSGLDNITDEVFCFGLLRTEQAYVCGPHDLWVRKTYRDLISYLFELSESNNGCLCYIASLLIQEHVKDLEICED